MFKKPTFCFQQRNLKLAPNQTICWFATPKNRRNHAKRYSSPISGEQGFEIKRFTHQRSLRFQAFHLSLAHRLDEVEACLLDMLNNRVAKRKESI